MVDYTGGTGGVDSLRTDMWYNGKKRTDLGVWDLGVREMAFGFKTLFNDKEERRDRGPLIDTHHTQRASDFSP